MLFGGEVNFVLDDKYVTAVWQEDVSPYNRPIYYDARSGLTP